MVLYVPRGIITALVTPTDPVTGELNFDELKRLLDFQLENGISGVLVLGTTGEFFGLTEKERIEVVDCVVKHINGRVPVLAGVLLPTTKPVIELARCYEELGATALLVPPPSHFSITIEGVVEHFMDISQATNLPLILYNTPGTTNFDIDMPVLEQLVGEEKIVAIKDCQRDVAKIALKIQRFGDEIEILSGDDDLGFPTFMLGSKGAIWAVPNIMPGTCVDLLACVEKGDVAAAREIYAKILAVCNSIFLPNFPGTLKEALGMLGWNVGYGRPPLQRMNPQEREFLKKQLQTVGLL
jgi:4-hydroxy-tetrahydrodipicolinate synthase